MNYRSTLNLPMTHFPMKANLSAREPEILEFWEREKIYQKVLKNREGRKKFILHDGPPYSNGSVHLAQALNKILKDITVKSKNMMGYYSPFIPGWDNHGLPNEITAIKTFKLNHRKTGEPELREKCRESALHFVRMQEAQFKRLGVMADWENPYLTLSPSYEASVVRVFRDLVKKGQIYRGQKPVHWCPSCETALAEAEIEYRNRLSPYIFVKFRLQNGKDIFPLADSPVYIPVWFSAPWIMAGNAALAVHPDESYCVARAGDECLVAAESLLDSVADLCEIEEYEILSSFPGKKLTNLVAIHPFLETTIPVIAHESVSMEQGSGCIHIAPGHGREDFAVASCKGLDIPVIIDESGVMTSESGIFAGMKFDTAEKEIVVFLKDKGLLLFHKDMENSFPHCWRCHEAVVFRAAMQWFVSLDTDNLRKRCQHEIDLANWYPLWGRDRIYNMMKDRPDWCISRQRTWGIPIPVFYCNDCGNPLLEENIIENIEKLFASEGSDIWFKKEVKELIPEGIHCSHCKSENFVKKTEIFDVWFESGVSYLALTEDRPDMPFPADMVLEGSHQHRGWFQTSLITSTAVRGRAPYRNSATQGWVLDNNGKTMHRSMGNVLDPDIIIGRYGADILRLFVTTVQWNTDMKVGMEIFEQVGGVYRKFRNIIRFMLGNLQDFDREMNSVDSGKLNTMDRWIIHRMELLKENTVEAYEKFDYHKVFHQIHDFCVHDLSRVYLEVTRNILYADSPDSHRRRSAQTAIFQVLKSLLIMVAPIISFTVEEAWRSCNALLQTSPSVFLEELKLNLAEESSLTKSEASLLDIMLELREQIFSLADKLREAGEIRDISRSRIEIHTRGQVKKAVEWDRELFRSLLKTVDLEIFDETSPIPANAVRSETLPETAFVLKHFTGEKCPRCREHWKKLEKDGLCGRCSDAMKIMQKV